MYEERCWLCPIQSLPFTVKIIDFGHARMQPENQDPIYNIRQPYTSLFLPYKDKSHLAQCLQTRLKISFPEEEEILYRDLMRKMRSTSSYSPTDLIDHAFFDNLRYIPEKNKIDWNIQLEHTYGDVNIFERIVLGRDDDSMLKSVREQGQEMRNSKTRRKWERNKKNKLVV